MSPDFFSKQSRVAALFGTDTQLCESSGDTTVSSSALESPQPFIFTAGPVYHSPTFTRNGKTTTFKVIQNSASSYKYRRENEILGAVIRWFSMQTTG